MGKEPLIDVEETKVGNIRDEINRRRTFAIISHPDAGKTTLTEKFLLYGGAINLAGSVKGLSLIHILSGRAASAGGG